jgi:hypothetical protein
MARPWRIGVGIVLLIGFGSLFNQSQSVYGPKSQALGEGGDKIVTYNTQAIYGALLWTEKYMPPGATMAAVPQGILLNYLTRRVNPTPCLFPHLRHRRNTSMAPIRGGCLFAPFKPDSLHSCPG